MPNKVYPEWVQKHKTKGTTVKRVGENYYLYKHTSKRVQGKKNPVPVDTYIGKITEAGVVKGTRKKVSSEDKVEVKEFGFSRAVQMLCPVGWKNVLGDSWENVLDNIIVFYSPESYIRNEKDIAPIDDNVYLGNQRRMLSTRLFREYEINTDDLKILSTIYLVTIGKTRMLSCISDTQQELLDRLGIELEVS